MKDERETRQKLLAFAKQEFMEKGYTAASLRSICRKAEVTTGALYFFFRDKADLFSTLVEEPVNRLCEIMISHYLEESRLRPEEISLRADGEEDIQAALALVRYIYEHYDTFLLVLTKSQGSGYENCIDRFVEITERHYRVLTDYMCRQWNRPPLDDYTIHWVAHMQVDAFAHMIIHEKSVDAACRHMEQTVKYLVSGFFGMVRG